MAGGPAPVRTGRYVEVQPGVRLHCAEAGEPGRPLLLFVHGFPEFWYAWKALLPAFADRWHAVAPDLRGFNLSDKPTDPKAYRPATLVAEPASKPAAAESAPAVAAPPAKPKATPKPKAATDIAPAPAGGTKPKALKSARAGLADDLKVIEGIGPALEKVLNENGIFHIDQIAQWGAAEVEWMDGNLKGFKGRVTRDKWVAQAKLIGEVGVEEFLRRAKTNDY